MDNLDGSFGYSVVFVVYGFENFGYVVEGGYLVQQSWLGGEEIYYCCSYCFQGFILQRGLQKLVIMVGLINGL